MWDTLRNIFKLGGKSGMLLLIYPVMYLALARRRDVSEYSSVDFSAFIFIIYSVVACFIAYKEIFKSDCSFGKKILFRSPICFFLIYSLLGLISMIWSVNYVLTGFRVFECVSMCLLITACIQNLFNHGSLDRVIQWSLIYCAWNMIWNLIRMAQWTTSIAMLLTSSQFMSTSFFYLAVYNHKKWYNYFVEIMSIFSMSTVAYIGMVLGLISSWWGSSKLKNISIFIGTALIIVSISIGPYQLLKSTVFFDKKEISIHQTSGRDNLLNATIETLDEHPLGLGFFSSEPYVIYSKGLHGVIGAHNSIFSASMGMGYLGILSITIFFVFLFKATFSKYIQPEYKAPLIGCFCVTFMHCMGNPSVGTRVYGAWIPCMYIFVLICAFYILGKYYEVTDTDDVNNLIE